MLKRSFLLNILLVGLVLFALLFIFFQSLNTITKHGQDAIVPKVEGQKLGAAVKALEGFELEIDSIYLPYKDPLEIIYQEPKAGSKVKRGRIIFLTVNKTTPPTVAMPELVNMSFRNAVLTLQSYRLIMGDTIFKPDIAAGAVLEQLFNGKPISAGTQIPIGSQVNLVVGAGLSDSVLNVPDFIGKSYAEVRSVLDGIGITANIVWDGSITDTNAAVVYNQFPESKNELDFENTITPGDMIDLRIMQRPSSELLRMNQAGSAKFSDPNDTNAVVTYGPPTSTLPIEGSNPDSVARKRRPRRIVPKTATDVEIDKIINDARNEATNASEKVIEKETEKPIEKPEPTIIKASPKKIEPVKPIVPDNKKPTTTVKPAAVIKPIKTTTEKVPAAKLPTKPVKKKPAVKDLDKNSNENDYK
jgi:eukaryotic-like serine/threonine-protein kinase